MRPFRTSVALALALGGAACESAPKPVPTITDANLSELQAQLQADLGFASSNAPAARSGARSKVQGSKEQKNGSQTDKAGSDDGGDKAGNGGGEAMRTLSAADANARFLQGVEVAQSHCAAYFRTLGRQQQDIELARRQTTLANSTGSAALGLAEAGRKTTAYVAAAFGVAQASFDNYESVYLFSPAVSSVEALVTNAQTAYLSEAQKAPPTTREQAVRYIFSFQQLCEVHTIRRLVNESLSSATPIAQSTQGLAKATLAVTALERASIAQAVGVKVLSDREIVYLYWLTFYTLTDEEAKKVGKALAGLGKIADTSGNLLNLDVNRKDLRDAFQGMMNRSSAELDADLELLRAPAPKTPTVPDEAPDGAGGKEAMGAASSSSSAAARGSIVVRIR